MDLKTIYQETEKRIQCLNFDAIFPGFRPYLFAVYNGQEVCMHGKLMPYEECFCGNTAINYHGEYLAIWDVECDPPVDMDSFAASLVHEMFHCHQFSCGEERFPSDLAILAHPGNLEYFSILFHENQYLADAFVQGDLHAAERVAAYRKQRQRLDPVLTEQQLKTETIEGMAEYAGLRALRMLNPGAFSCLTERYLQILRANDSRILDIRRISYYTGAIYFLMLEKLGKSVVNDFKSKVLAYEQNPVDADTEAEPVPACPELEQNYHAFTQERQATLSAFLKNARYLHRNGVICGYDPMNMFRLKNLVYCSHFVRISENGKEQNFFVPVALKMADGSERRIVGYYIQDRNDET